MSEEIDDDCNALKDKFLELVLTQKKQHFQDATADVTASMLQQQRLCLSLLTGLVIGHGSADNSKGK